MMFAYSVLEGIRDSVFCILVVYGMLFLLSLTIRPLKWIKVREEKGDDEEAAETPAAPAPKPFGIEDIKDEDMMVAALVASIDARETTKTDMVVKSVKEIR